MHFTSPNANFLTQGALPWTPVKGFAPGGGPIGGPKPHSWVHTLRARCFSLQVIPKSWKPCVIWDKGETRTQGGRPLWINTREYHTQQQDTYHRQSLHLTPRTYHRLHAADPTAATKCHELCMTSMVKLYSYRPNQLPNSQKYTSVN